MKPAPVRSSCAGVRCFWAVVMPFITFMCITCHDFSAILSVFIGQPICPSLLLVRQPLPPTVVVWGVLSFHSVSLIDLFNSAETHSQKASTFEVNHQPHAPDAYTPSQWSIFRIEICAGVIFSGLISIALENVENKLDVQIKKNGNFFHVYLVL